MKLIKNAAEIAVMKKAGHILAEILQELGSSVQVGIDVWTLEEKFRDLCKLNKVTPACLGYARGHAAPFPTGLCIGINQQAVHCYPQKGYLLQDGDLLKIDTVIALEGLNVDSAVTIGVGNVNERREKLLNTTRLALQAAINMVKDGVHVGDIGYAIQTVASMSGFDVLREYTGHGIGYEMHEYPNVPCYGQKGEGFILKSGMIIAIEPLLCSGHHEVQTFPKSWETQMADGGDFSQFEHTVLVKSKGAEILTI
jgi:methionyl aminopeptidase